MIFSKQFSIKLDVGKIHKTDISSIAYKMIDILKLKNLIPVFSIVSVDDVTYDGIEEFNSKFVDKKYSYFAITIDAGSLNMFSCCLTQDDSDTALIFSAHTDEVITQELCTSLISYLTNNGYIKQDYQRHQTSNINVQKTNVSNKPLYKSELFWTIVGVAIATVIGIVQIAFN